MAVSLPEHWACVNGNDHDFDQFEVQEIDGALLTSLLEEANVEDYDNDRLTSVIKLLEAEIDPNMINVGDLPMELGLCTDSIGFEPFDVAQVDDLGCLIAHDLDDFDWMEVEMIPPSSPNNYEMSNWYMDPCVELDGIIGFGDVNDFSNMYYAVPSEELSYGSLWQETHVSDVM